MKKLILLLAMAGVGPTMYCQEGSFKPKFTAPISKEKPGKPAPWMRPATEATVLVEKGRPLPKGYVVDKERTKDGSGRVVAKKQLPISGKEEFWNKFISGYGDDKMVAEEMRVKKAGWKNPLTRDLGRGLTNEEFEKEKKRLALERAFLSRVEKETPHHYVNPQNVKPQTGWFSGIRNWWNNLCKSNTPSVSAGPTSVPFQAPESE